MPPTDRSLRVVVLLSILLTAGACAASQGAEDPTPVTLGGVGVTPRQAGGASADPSGSILADQALPTAPAPTVAVSMPEVPRVADDRVFMVGDSVLQAMASGSPDSIDLYVGALGWKVTVDAVQGRFTDEGIRVLRARRREVHDLAVVMLGNNYSGDEAEFAREVQAVLDLLDDTKAIVWFTTPLFHDDQREVNDVLREAASRDPRLVLLDWETASAQWAGALRPDGIHPTQFGSDILAQMVGSALGRAPGVGPEVTLPRIGSTERPGDTRAVDKGEGRSTPRPVDATTATVPLPPTTTRPPKTTVPPGTPTTTLPPTFTTPPRTTVPGGTSTTTAPTSTTGGQGSTTSSSSSTSSTSSSTTTSSTTTSSTTSTTTTTTTTTAPPATDPPATDPPATTPAGP